MAMGEGKSPMETLFEAEKLFLKQVQQVGWEMSVGSTGFAFHAPSREHAKRFCNVYLIQLAAIARRFNFPHTLVFYPRCSKPYRILPSMCARNALNQWIGAMMEEKRGKSMVNNPQIDLLGADYIRIHEFLIEQKQSGHIVVVTSNITRDESGNPISTPNPRAGRDICHHTSDLLLPSRAYWSAKQFSGYNYRLSWRAGRDDYDNLNPQYEQLKETLARDGYAPNYEYTLYRPDGALCSYSTTYFLCRDYLGDEVRVGVSKPNDWQLLEAA